MGADPRWTSPTSIRLPVAQLAQLDALAAERGTTRSALVQAAVRAWLHEQAGELRAVQPGLEGFADG